MTEIYFVNIIFFFSTVEDWKSQIIILTRNGYAKALSTYPHEDNRSHHDLEISFYKVAVHCVS